MTIKRIDDGGKGHRSWRVIMTECPACGMAVGRDGEKLVQTHLLDDHEPEDFGLSPRTAEHVSTQKAESVNYEDHLKRFDPFELIVSKVLHDGYFDPVDLKLQKSFNFQKAAREAEERKAAEPTKYQKIMHDVIDDGEGGVEV